MFLLSSKVVRKLTESKVYKKTKAYELVRTYRDAHGYSIDTPIDLVKFSEYHKLDKEAIIKICFSTNPTIKA